MDQKIGVYLCTGCGIGDSLDIEKLSAIALKQYNVPVCKTHPFLCNDEGLELIKNDINGDGINTVVIAACSIRVHQDTFFFDPMQIITERVNFREQVVWCHEPNNEDTQMLAEDNLRIGITKAQKTKLPEPFIEEMSKKILVVGGGISGMTSALEAAKTGYEVVLVEKEPNLGGFLTKLHKRFPRLAPYQKPEETGIERCIKEVEENNNIKMLTSAAIASISGAPGMFDVKIKQNGSFLEERMGSIILATGGRPYDANKLSRFGFGKFKNVITNAMMEEFASDNKITRPLDGQIAESVAFIQCAGSRDPEHLSYCSTHCCRTSMKQALYVREQNPDSKVYIFYKDIRSPAQNENFYKKVQEDPGVFFSKGEFTEIKEDDEKKLILTFENTLLGEKVNVKADLVVLAIGLVSTNPEYIERTLTNENKEACVTKPDTTESKASEEADNHTNKDSLLNLQYRLGPDLPDLKYGFPDSHFICFPYETRRTGIYAAGCVRSPIDSGTSLVDAAGAAMKAIQCIELVSQGKAVHPRAGDLAYPDFYLLRCTQCKRCTEECPFGVLDEDEKGTPKSHPTRCRRCGVCMGACPERIISFTNYNVDMIASMIKEIEIPEEDEEKPRILALVCENDAYPALDIAGLKRLKYNSYVRIIPLRCLGSINLVWITDALSSGFDGIIMIGCKHGDDYQCHFIQGSELADTRLGKVKETLDRLQLESDRIQLHQFAINDYNKVPEILDNFLKKIEEIGPNPYKEL